MGLLDGFLQPDSQLTWLAASKTTISEAFDLHVKQRGVRLAPGSMNYNRDPRSLGRAMFEVIRDLAVQCELQGMPCPHISCPHDSKVLTQWFLSCRVELCRACFIALHDEYPI